MNRRVIGIVVAVVLAIAGTTLLVKYVQSAKDDAVADEAQVTLLVLSDDIAKGAPLADIENAVTPTKVPQRLRAAGALETLDGVDPTYVAAVDMTTGEQLLSSRLVDPRTLVRVGVPKGLQEVTISLSPERAVGADLRPGDTVGVIFSFDPFTITTPTSQPTETTSLTQTPNMTHLTLHKVLVTSVQFSKDDSQRAAEITGNRGDEESDTTVSATVVESPSDSLLVTLAVRAPEAEQIVFAAEFGAIWLTSENAAASEDGTRILTQPQVYVTVPR